METKANYALIGAFVLLTLIASIGFVAWLSGSQFDQEFDEYEVVFTGAVRGLSVGGEVRYNGLRVGEVTRLSLDPENSNTVIATVEIDANTPIRSNSFARLEPLGLTGLSYIQIFAGSDEFPLLKELDDESYQIPGEGSTLDSILDGGDDVVTNATITLQRATALLSDEAIGDFQGILSNLNTITGKLAETDLDPDTLNNLLQSVTAAAEQVTVTLRTYDALGQDVRGLLDGDVPQLMQQIDGVVARVRGVLDTVDGAVGSYDQLAAKGQLLVADMRDAVNRLSNSGLTDIEETTNSLRELSGSLTRIAEELEKNPLSFIVGEDRETVEIPQ